MTELQPAARELTDLAVAMRGWDRDETAGAILAAKNAGWTFERTFCEVCRLLLLEDGAPSALRHAARKLNPAEGPAADGPAEAAKYRELYPNLRRPGSAA